MKRLLLLRHAKSSWDNELADHDRPLNARGERAATLMGAYMRQAGLIPDLTLCSTAVRTRETLAWVESAIGTKLKVDYQSGLYMASGGQIADAIRAAPDDVRTVLLIGHNPGMEEAALRLSEPDGNGLRDDIAAKYPTGALSVIDFDADSWRDIETGALRDFRKPKTLV